MNLVFMDANGDPIQPTIVNEDDLVVFKNIEFPANIFEQLEEAKRKGAVWMSILEPGEVLVFKNWKNIPMFPDVKRMSVPKLEYKEGDIND